LAMLARDLEVSFAWTPVSARPALVRHLPFFGAAPWRAR
jgi:hypothetical protein